MKKFRAPKGLSRPAAKLWRDLQHEYEITDTAGILLLTKVCECFDTAAEAQRAIDENGLTFQDRFGCPKPNPACAILRDARSSMLAALKNLNLDIEPLRDGPGRPPGI